MGRMTPRTAYLWIVAGLIVWGVVHAIGAYRFNHNVWRGAMVLGASAAFLAFWALMAANRQRRLRKAAGGPSPRLESEPRL